MTNTPLAFDGVLFFPVTPFTPDDTVDYDLLAEHTGRRLAFGPGGVSLACSTGEFHALSRDEVTTVTRTAVDVVNGAVPVVAGVGGSLGDARILARESEEAGADALLVLPPYLVGAPVSGLVRYVEEVAAANGLPVIVYYRGKVLFTADALGRLAQNPKVIGFKDGTGDVGLAQEIVLAVEAADRDDFQLFNGLLTAEITQGAYRGLGVLLYSSASFAMIPELSRAHYLAYSSGDETTRLLLLLLLLRNFYQPFVRLRDQTPGFGVSLIKAGLRLRGMDVGSVRPPLMDPNPEQTAELERLLAIGDHLVEGLGA